MCKEKCGENLTKSEQQDAGSVRCEALLGCPFCGEHDLEIGHNIAGGYCVRCNECGAHGPIATSEERARKWWNE